MGGGGGGTVEHALPLARAVEVSLSWKLQPGCVVLATEDDPLPDCLQSDGERGEVQPALAAGCSSPSLPTAAGIRSG